LVCFLIVNKIIIGKKKQKKKKKKKGDHLFILWSWKS